MHCLRRSKPVRERSLRYGWSKAAISAVALGAVALAVAAPAAADPLRTADSVSGQAENGSAAFRSGATETEPSPAATPQRSSAGAFAKGRKRVGLYGGAGSSYNQTYLIIGLGAGYYLVDGLELGLEFEGWFLHSPQYYKLAPQLRYIFWQLRPVLPYVGAFYRKTWVTDDFPDLDSWGGRAGLAYSSGRGYAAIGVVYERYTSDVTDRDHWYPEFGFWLTF